MAKIRDMLGTAGWKTPPDTEPHRLLMTYDGKNISQKIEIDDKLTVPLKCIWRFMVKDKVQDIFIDYGEQLDTLASIASEYGPRKQTRIITAAS